MSAGDGSHGTLDSISSRDVEECLRMLEEVWPGTDDQAAGMPQQFGRFSIVSELGRGGFGVVFLAEDPLLERWVALKVPRVEVFSQSQGWRRFLREARTASRLDHPNLVPLLEAGTIGPVGYIVSAFVEGPTLEQCLRDARGGAGPVQRSVGRDTRRRHRAHARSGNSPSGPQAGQHPDASSRIRRRARHAAGVG